MSLWLLAAGVLATAVTASASVRGRAYGCYVNLPGEGIRNVTHCDTGWLDPVTGGSRSSYKNNVSYGTALHIDHMEDESHGDDCKGHSSSTLEGGYIMKGRPGEVTWTHLESADEDTCCRPERGDDDIRSVFQGLTFGGRPVVVTGQTNQVLTIPGVATLILNERQRDDGDDPCDGDHGEHHSMRWIGYGGSGEVILGAARFDSDDHCCRALPAHHSTWGALKQGYR